MPGPMTDAFFISLPTQPDHSSSDTIRWSYETKFKGAVPERQPRTTHAEVCRGPDASQLLPMTEAFEPRLVSRIKAWSRRNSCAFA
jgi:hypothetical protein